MSFLMWSFLPRWFRRRVWCANRLKAFDFVNITGSIDKSKIALKSQTFEDSRFNHGRQFILSGWWNQPSDHLRRLRPNKHTRYDFRQTLSLRGTIVSQPFNHSIEASSFKLSIIYSFLISTLEDYKSFLTPSTIFTSPKSNIAPWPSCGLYTKLCSYATASSLASSA